MTGRTNSTQADSIINTMIAKQSQRTADESKNVAVGTRRDSTSMKTIASLTMVYLPSTFVATIFSTGFFEFGSDGTSALSVNVDIWKFIVVAAIFTALTISVWVYLNNCGVPRLLRWAKHDGQKIDDAKSRPPPPTRILLDLPQRPGNRANGTVLEASPASESQSLREGQQMEDAPASPVSAQVNGDINSKEQEAAEKSV